MRDEGPAEEAPGEALMTLSVGTRLGPYEIQSAIGAGGRGSALELAERSPAKANSYENAPVARFPRRSEVK